ncbi:MAG: hypothetical protein ABFE07_29385 [Armatimonadia bacterium]
MHDGYVKLWRKSKDSAVFMDAGLWHLWSYCLMEATHRPIKRIFHGKETVINPGQFTTGRLQLAFVLGGKPTTIWSRLLKLSGLGMVTLDSDNHFTIVTICKWETYQSNEKSVSTTGRQPIDNGSTTDRQPFDTLQEAKKLSTKKNNTTSGGSPAPVGPEASSSAQVEFMTRWNALPAPIKKCDEMTPKRRKLLATRLADKYWKENWCRALELIPKYGFLMGRGSRGWVANVNWFLERPEAVIKIIEGQYSDGAATGRTFASMDDDPDKFNRVKARTIVVGENHDNPGPEGGAVAQDGPGKPGGVPEGPGGP